MLKLFTKYAKRTAILDKLLLMTKGVTEMDKINCAKCGETIDATTKYCPNCGASQIIDLKKQKKKKRKKIIAAILVLVLLLSGWAIKNVEYYANMGNITYMIVNSTVDTVEAGNLISSVWYNAIHHKRDTDTDKFTMQNGRFVDDFNLALDNLFADQDFMADIAKINDDRENVKEVMKKLNNPPQKYAEAYSVLQTFYECYMQMTALVINPTGSYNTFSEDFIEYDKELFNLYEKMELYLD